MNQPILDIVENRLNALDIPNNGYIVSEDCYEDLGKLRAELLEALDVVDKYVEATALYIIHGDQNED